MHKYKVTVEVYAENMIEAVKEVGYRLHVHNLETLKDHVESLKVEEVEES